ncbi:MAG: hypothetical protein WCA11_02970 [Terracidiphilus sp.]
MTPTPERDNTLRHWTAPYLGRILTRYKKRYTAQLVTDENGELNWIGLECASFRENIEAGDLLGRAIVVSDSKILPKVSAEMLSEISPFRVHP